MTPRRQPNTLNDINTVAPDFFSLPRASNGIQREEFVKRAAAFVAVMESLGRCAMIHSDTSDDDALIYLSSVPNIAPQKHRRG